MLSTHKRSWENFTDGRSTAAGMARPENDLDPDQDLIKMINIDQNGHSLGHFKIIFNIWSKNDQVKIIIYYDL